MRDDVSGIVLAGGNSSRFKTDKALLKWDGEPLLLRQVRLLKSLLEEVIVAGGKRRRVDGAIAVEDLIKGKGPLGGIHAGLKASSNDYNLIIPCDLPFLRGEVLSMLLDEIDGRSWVILPVVRGYVEPLVGVYHRGCLPHIEELLKSDRLKVTELLSLVPFKLIPEERVLRVDPDLRSFFNLNTPRDYRRALAMKGAG